jgi:LysM repeat protein
MMAAKLNMDYDDLKQLNPKFKGEIAPAKGSVLELRVPLGTTQMALAAAQASFVDKVEYIADAGETEMYKIRSGDSLSTVARKYHTTIAWLRDVNDLKNGRKLRVGQRIAVPDRNGKKPTAVKYVAKNTEKVEKADAGADSSERALANPEIVTKKGVFYVVQAGDTLSAIADDYSSTVDELRRMNKMSRGTVLRAGMKLKVPKDEGLPADPSGAKASDRVAENDRGGESDSATATSDKTDSASAAPVTTATVAPKEKTDVEATKTTADSREPQSTGSSSDQSSHVVRPGDNLTTIAHKYGVTIQAIRKANGLKKRSVLKVGGRLVIPVDPRPQSRSGSGRFQKNQKIMMTASYRAPASLRKNRHPRIHIVRRGENLTQIAEKYNISLNALRDENRKIRGAGAKLFIGSKLLIPTANASY